MSISGLAQASNSACFPKLTALRFLQMTAMLPLAATSYLVEIHNIAFHNSKASMLESVLQTVLSQMLSPFLKIRQGQS